MDTTDKRKIGIAINTYNKCDDVIKCIEQIKDDERIETITIIDNHSEDVIYWLLEDTLYIEEGETKIRLGRNDTHLDEELNKHRSILLSDAEWILSVNPLIVLDGELINEIFKQEWKKETIEIGDGILFLNREQYLKTSPYSIHLEKQEEV